MGSPSILDDLSHSGRCDLIRYLGEIGHIRPCEYLNRFRIFDGFTSCELHNHLEGPDLFGSPKTLDLVGKP